METGAINNADFTLMATHEVCLIVFSVLIGIVVCYTALALAKKVTLTQSIASNFWLAGGAIAASFSALWLAFYLKTKTSVAGLAKAGDTILMGSAIAEMHYTAMAAVSFKLSPQPVMQLLLPLDNDLLAVAIGIASLIILSLTLLSSVFEQHRNAETVTRVEALKQTEERFRNFVETTSDLFWETDQNGFLTYVSPQIHNILGYEHTEALGKTPFDFMPEEDAKRGAEIFANYVAAQQPFTPWENTNIHKNGHLVVLETSGVPLLNSDGSLRGYRGVARDITERKRVEAALQASEAELRALFSAMNDIIIVLDTQGRYLKIAPTNPDLLYKPAAELIGETLHDVLPQSQADTFLSHIHRALNTRKTVTLEYSLHIGVTEIWFSGAISPMLEDTVIVVAHDITKHKRAEEGLRHSEKRFRSLVEQAADGFFLHYLNGKFIDVNQQACNSLGYTREELLSLSIFDIEQNLIPETMMPQLMEQLVSGIAATHNGVHKRKNGTTFPVEIRLGLFDADGCQHILALVRDISDRQQTEEVLRKSQESYRAFIEQSSEAIWRFELDLPLSTERSENEQIQHLYQYGYLAECNNAMAKMYGFDCAAEIVGLRLGDLINSSDSHNIECLRNFIRSGYRLQDAESHEIGRQGNFNYLLNNLVGIVEAGYLFRAWGSQRDITERKQIEEALRQSEAKNRALLNAIPDLMLRISRDGTYLDFKQAKDFGILVPDTELIGKSEYEVLPPALAQQRMHYVELALETGEIQIFEYQLLLNGKIQHEEARIVVSGKDEVLVIIRNITERKQAEEALKKSEQKLSLHMQQTPLAVIEWNTNFEITEWNPAAEAIFGYSKTEVVGRHKAEILIPKYAKEQVNKVLDNLLAQKGGTRSTNENLTKDGRTIICEWYNTPLVAQSGRVIGVASLAQDITERKQAELELQKALITAEAANQAKSEFLANMSHEIRTPMNGVIGMTGLLLDTELTPQQRDFVETIRSCGDTLLTIINDILDFSKIESGKLDLEEQPLELRACIEEALDLLAPKAAEKNLELVYLLKPQTPNTVVGDVTRLRQILVNLLSNAVKFTETGEVVVSVTARKLGAREQLGTGNQKLENSTCFSPSLQPLASSLSYEIQFAVKDTGIGIPQEKMDRLFQSFSQVDSSITRQYGGTGLGLAISKRLSEMMGGKIWVESRGALGGNPPPQWKLSSDINLPLQGKGSTFYFTMVAKSVSETVLVNHHCFRQQLAGKRVLIVDDNATNRKILALQGHSWGMLTRTVASGAEALDAIHQKEPFDIAILDMQMPTMDGLTLAAEIRKQPDYQKLPLVMLTSMGKQELAVTDANSEFAVCLNKPVKQSQLCNVLLQILSEQPIKVASSTTSAQIDSKLAQVRPLRILLAEDNLVNQKVALHILQQMGYRADVAANGLEVLQALERQPYDVVLMDVQMPEMDGLTATRHICQKWSQDSRPQIIATTANAMQGDRELCIDAGMDDYLSKPLRVEELIQALSKCQSKKAGEARENNSDFAHPSKIAPIDAKALQTLRELAGEDASIFIVAVIDAFLEDAPKLLQEIGQAIVQGDAVTLQRAAHTLKSSSATLGAMTLSQFCKQLEAISRAGTIEGGAQIAAQIEVEYETVKTALQIKRQEFYS